MKTRIASLVITLCFGLSILCYSPANAVQLTMNCTEKVCVEAGKQDATTLLSSNASSTDVLAEMSTCGAVLEETGATKIIYIEDPSSDMIIVEGGSSLKNPLDKHQMSSTELNANTMELLQMVITSNYVDQAFFLARALSSTAESFEPRYSEFNAYQELISREDFVEVLLTYLNSMDSTSVWSNIAQEQLISRMIEHSDIMSIPANRSIPRAEPFSNATNTLNERIIERDPVFGDIYLQLNAVYTMVGGQNVALLKPTREYTVDEQRAIDEWAEDIDGAVCVVSADISYNCHSYAWYSMNSANPYWIEDIDIVLQDTSIVPISSVNDIQLKDIIVYYNAQGEPVHSAIVVDIVNETLMLQSKWGMFGVFYHSIDAVPSDYLGANGNVNFRIYRYHDYDYRYTQEQYHEGLFHYYEYADICMICNHKTNTTWVTQRCAGGSSCVLPFTFKLPIGEEEA